MELKQFEGESLLYVAIEPDRYDPDKDYPMIIMLHGFGANMRDLVSLAPVISRAGYVYTCPNAPIPFQIGLGSSGFGWSTPRDPNSEEESVQSAGKLEIFFDEVFEQYNIKPGRTLLMGFSQGGGMTYRMGLPRPETFAGLGALSGAMSNWDVIKDRLPERRDQPIFIAHGLNDPLVTLERAHEAKNFLEANGYSPIYKEYPMAHEISQDVLDDLTPWIKEVLPPAA